MPLLQLPALWVDDVSVERASDRLIIGNRDPAPDEVRACEPFLVRQGLLIRTPRGRVATAAAWQHLGMVPPPSALPGSVDPSLFD